MLVESMDVTQLGFIEEAGLLVVLSENVSSTQTPFGYSAD